MRFRSWTRDTVSFQANDKRLSSCCAVFVGGTTDLTLLKVVEGENETQELERIAVGGHLLDRILST